MNVPTQTEPMAEQPVAIGSTELQPLHSAFAALLLAHYTPCGCKPTDEHIEKISRHSEAAILAIRMALSTAIAAHGEQQH
ncbi:hypothetical protein LWE61_08225 [Sphingobium sufflavum]|uniref:hypothetical protein n=1 Tax=Sphingobium sufflavum TaxID=1129547 RepID=UPI001F1B8002|nr:hypothetical protein [Sphingobium sufflavum]MCE7796548.1 hypothetical protein [Sphingobium sufflavum]